VTCHYLLYPLLQPLLHSGQRPSSLARRLPRPLRHVLHRQLVLLSDFLARLVAGEGRQFEFEFFGEVTPLDGAYFAGFVGLVSWFDLLELLASFVVPVHWVAVLAAAPDAGD
jgi:hypothetical protein